MPLPNADPKPKKELLDWVRDCGTDKTSVVEQGALVCWTPDQCDLLIAAALRG